MDITSDFAATKILEDWECERVSHSVDENIGYKFINGIHTQYNGPQTLSD